MRRQGEEVNTFISTFNSGVASISEETTHPSVEDYLAFKFGSQHAFADFGGRSIEMVVPEQATEVKESTKKKEAVVDE